MQISKQFKFPMGHRLTFHKEKCYNPHGHNYTVEAIIEGDVDKDGMVIDFDYLDNILSPTIAKLDHSFWIFSEDKVMLNLFNNKEIKQKPFKTNIVNKESTAENIAEWIYNEVKPRLSEFKNVKSFKIKVWETDDCYAEYTNKNI